MRKMRTLEEFGKEDTEQNTTERTEGAFRTNLPV